MAGWVVGPNPNRPHSQHQQEAVAVASVEASAAATVAGSAEEIVAGSVVEIAADEEDLVEVAEGE